MKNIILILILALIAISGFSQSYHQDNLGRIDTIRYPDSSLEVLKYDHTGNILSRIMFSNCDKYALPFISGKHFICKGDSTQLTSSLAMQYLWSTGDTTQFIWVRDTGKYSVKITYANECEKTSLPYSVGFFLASTDTIRQSKPKLCTNNDTIRLYTTGANKYLWKNGDTTANIKVTDTGRYSVQITDTNNCKLNDSVYIARAVLYPLTLQCNDSILCPLESITISANAHFSNYIWNSGGTSSSVSISQAGSYSVSAIDTNGCNVQSRAIAIQSSPIKLNPNIDTILCYKSANGKIDLRPDSADKYIYLWSGGKTTPIIENLASGSYPVTITDKNSGDVCPMSFSIREAGKIVTSTSKTNAKCFGTGTGTIQVNVLGSGYTYAWVDGANTQNRTSLTKGIYTVTVSETSTGCTDTETISLSEPTEVKSIAENIVETCQDSTTGKFTISSMGGIAPYTYSLDGDTSTSNSSFENLTAKNYTLLTRDANSCETSITVTIPLKDCSSSAISNISENSHFTLYPNPNQGVFQLEFSDKIKDLVDIEIYTIDGKLIKKIEHIDTRINKIITIQIDKLSSGTYDLNVITKSSNMYNIKFKINY